MTCCKAVSAGAILTAIAVTLTGCSGTTSSPGRAASTAAGSSSSAASPDTAGASPSAGSTGAAIPDTQLTGTQLTAARLTSGDVGVAGFSPDMGGGDSGGSLTTAKAKFSPSTMSCTAFQNDIGGGGFGETAWTDQALINASSKEILSEAVYQFATPALAEAFYNAVKAKTSASSCRTFTISSQGFSTTLTVTMTPAEPGVGLQDFADTQIGTANGAPNALAETVALDGPDVLMVNADRQNQSTVATDVDTGTLLAKLIAKIAAA